MSRENRMLVMFVAGMVILFTYFRIQYPNIGGGDALRQEVGAPEIKVFCDTSLQGGVEKVVRSYELEFGVRVVLSSSDGGMPNLTDYDLVVGAAGKRTDLEDGVIHTYSIPPWNPNSDGDAETEWVIGLRSVTDLRQAGAARLARYLVARDRGLPIVSPDLEIEAEADLWGEDPSPTIVVWEGVFPYIQPALGAFEQLEDISLRLVVGDCGLVSAKLREPDGVDGVLLLGAECDLGRVSQSGEFYALGTRDLVLISSTQGPPLIGADGGLLAEAGSIGYLPGFHSMVTATLDGDSAMPRLKRLIRDASKRPFSRMGELLDALEGDDNLIGLGIEWPLDNAATPVKTERFERGKIAFPLRLWVSEASDAKHLLSRMARTLRVLEQRASEVDAGP